MKRFNLKVALAIIWPIKACIVVLFSNFASADKLCLQTNVNKKNFRATHRSVIAATCPKGYAELADTASLRGPSGPTGPQGPMGPQGASGAQGAVGAAGRDGADVSYRCVRREASAAGSGVLIISTGCLVNEYILDSACYTADGPGVVAQKRLFTANNTQLSNEIYHSVLCASYDPGTFVSSGSSYTLVAQAQCCVGR